MFSENNKSKYTNTGVGLGLSYCKMVVQQMDGDIHCTSIPNKGTSFDFYIKVGCKNTIEDTQESDHLKFQFQIKDLIK